MATRVWLQEQGQVQEHRRDFVPEREPQPMRRREYAPECDREHQIKPPKHNFPKFNGENPSLWLDIGRTCWNLLRRIQ